MSGGWTVPASPAPLVQERAGVAGDPWRMLVVCVLCNMTPGERAYPSDLPGVGRYARDAWAIFVEGRDDVFPADGHLMRYVRWRQEVGTWGTVSA
ncbi:MAG: hypothetical protein EBT79_10465 [Actinobacteria bacterium]|nr:hypothetical protein [Actinomycetota bacterium]NBR67675.1 hypothetical protein [Actinomycetota bacterium]